MRKRTANSHKFTSAHANGQALGTSLPTKQAGNKKKSLPHVRTRGPSRSWYYGVFAAKYMRSFNLEDIQLEHQKTQLCGIACQSHKQHKASSFNWQHTYVVLALQSAHGVEGVCLVDPSHQNLTSYSLIKQLWVTGKKDRTKNWRC